MELIPAENTNVEDPEEAGIGGAFPILVIRTSSGNRNPFFGNFNPLSAIFGDDDSSFFPDFRIDEDSNGDAAVTVIDPEDNVDDEVTQVSSGCGLLCVLFRDLETRIKSVEEEIKEAQANRENEIESSDGKSEPETTYEEKVS